MPRRFAEIALGGGFHAIGAGTEIDAVEIEFEDLCLGELVLEPEGERHLLQLARYGALLRQKQVLGELLGDGGSALRGAAPQHVLDDGAHDAPRIDAVMRIEAAILDGDEGLGHVIRQFAQRHRRAAHVAAGGERRAVGAEDQHRGRALGNFQRLDRRQVDADPDERADCADHRPEREHRAPIDQPADAGTAFAAAAAAPLTSLARRGGLTTPPAAVAARSGRPAGAVLRAQPEVENACVRRPFAARLSSPRHVPSPRNALPHDPEKWLPVFGKDHALAEADGRERGLRAGYRSIEPLPAARGGMGISGKGGHMLLKMKWLPSSQSGW